MMPSDIACTSASTGALVAPVAKSSPSADVLFAVMFPKLLFELVEEASGREAPSSSVCGGCSTEADDDKGPSKSLARNSSSERCIQLVSFDSVAETGAGKDGCLPVVVDVGEGGEGCRGGRSSGVFVFFFSLSPKRYSPCDKKTKRNVLILEGVFAYANKIVHESILSVQK